MIGVDGDRERLATPRSDEAFGAHQTFDGATRNTDVLRIQLGLHLVGAIHEQVLGVDPVDPDDQFSITRRAC